MLVKVGSESTATTPSFGSPSPTTWARCATRQRRASIDRSHGPTTRLYRLDILAKSDVRVTVDANNDIGIRLLDAPAAESHGDPAWISFAR